MNKNLFYRLSTLWLLAPIIFLFNSCQDKKEAKTVSTTTNLENKLVITVSVPPQAYFAERIGGNKVHVNVMIPQSNSPASYSPTINQLIQLSQSQIYIKVGSDSFPFEKAHFDTILKANKKIKIIDMSKNIKLLHFNSDTESFTKTGTADKTVTSNKPSHHHGNIDPHIWFSPSVVKKCVENIYREISITDPDNHSYYKNNYLRFIKEIDELDLEIKKNLKNIKRKTFLTYHPSWGYFSHEYGLKQLSIETDNKEPSAKEMKNIIDLAKAYQIKVIFTQKAFSRKSADVIAKELKAKIVELNPLEKNWLNNMRKMSQVFKDALE